MFRIGLVVTAAVAALAIASPAGHPRSSSGTAFALAARLPALSHAKGGIWARSRGMSGCTRRARATRRRGRGGSVDRAGHHIASTAPTHPGPPSNWGPKRWATAAHICPRAHWNTAYPGDESLLYKLNPGEAFAETYRVLVDTQLGEEHPTWPLVDPSFYPDQAAIHAVEQDVASPWSGPIVHTYRLHGKTWQHDLPTPLDGTITVHTTAKAQLTLTGDHGHPLQPIKQPGRAPVYEVCGQRSVTVRVSSPSGSRLEVRVTIP